MKSARQGKKAFTHDIWQPSGQTCAWVSRGPGKKERPRTRFSTNVALQGREPAHTLLVVDERAAHKKAAQALNMAEGDPPSLSR
jgi:hypothetical protein